MADRNCPKCGAVMQEGFVIDDAFEGKVAQWAEGKPIPSRWFGLKISKDAMHPISMFRCSGCGFLESYAAVG